MFPESLESYICADFFKNIKIMFWRILKKKYFRLLAVQIFWLICSMYFPLITGELNGSAWLGSFPSPHQHPTIWGWSGMSCSWWTFQQVCVSWEICSRSWQICWGVTSSDFTFLFLLLSWQNEIIRRSFNCSCSLWSHKMCFVWCSADRPEPTPLQKHLGLIKRIMCQQGV